MATRRAALLLALVMAMADERAGLVLSGLVSDRTLRYVAAFARTRAARFIRLQAAAPTNHTGGLAGPCVAPCGLDCTAVRAANLTSATRVRGVLDARTVDITCRDRPNRGKEFGGFVEWALERYDAREDGAVVFAPTELTAHRRAEVVRRLLQRAPRPKPRPRSASAANRRRWEEEDAAAAAQHARWTAECMPPPGGGGARSGAGWAASNYSLTRALEAARLCEARGREVRCAHRHAVERPPPVQPAAYEQMDAPYALEWWRREEAVTRAEPNELGAWLSAHAPTPATAARGACLKGVFRTTMAALRARPRAEFARIREQLWFENPEAGHFLERAALYVFAAGDAPDPPEQPAVAARGPQGVS